MEYIDLKTQYKRMQRQINSRLTACMDNADFIMGSAVYDLESRLAEYIGVKHVVSCGSGTDALQLICMAYGIGRGDAVFCPAMTFIASVEPAVLLGAEPVFCEIDGCSYNLLPQSLERQVQKVIEEKKLVPKAVIAVDFLGNPADYDSIRAVAKKYQLLLIEDAAQSMGAVYRGKKCGSLGDIAAASFFPSKPLGAYGDGGAVFTDRDDIAQLLRSIRCHGKGADKYHNIRIGINSRLDTIQAEILRIKLEYLEEEIQARQKIAERYDGALESFVKLPFIDENSRSSYAQYVICLSEKEERDGLKEYLEEHEIPSIIYYPNPLHLLPVFEQSNRYGESFICAEHYACTNLGIPFSPDLHGVHQEKVIDAVRDYLKRRSRG